MTTLSITQTARPTVRARPSRFARAVELLMVGGLTPLCFLASWVLRRQLDLDAAELAVGFTFFHLAFIVNDPHFAVTYLLFYEDFNARAFGDAFSRSMRLRYWIAGLLVPALLAVWGLLAVVAGSAEHLGLLIELMFVLVGWHYVKQGFGVMIVLSARRGLRFSRVERSIVLAHCFSGWAYAWLNPHVEARQVQEKGVIYLALPRPQLAEMVALGAVVLSGVLLVGMLVLKHRREGGLPSLAALTALLCSIWCWLVFSNADPLVRYMTPALHSLQYLYFVCLLKQNEAKARVVEPYFEPPPRERLLVLAVLALGLGFALFHAAPDALDAMFAQAPTFGWGVSLGPTPYFAALYAVVNIHHYFMDFVIWRRENPRTRFLATT